MTGNAARLSTEARARGKPDRSTVWLNRAGRIASVPPAVAEAPHLKPSTRGIDATVAAVASPGYRAMMLDTAQFARDAKKKASASPSWSAPAPNPPWPRRAAATTSMRAQYGPQFTSLTVAESLPPVRPMILRGVNVWINRS